MRAVAFGGGEARGGVYSESTGARGGRGEERGGLQGGFFVELERIQSMLGVHHMMSLVAGRSTGDF